MCFGVPGPQGGRRCAGDDDVSPAMANRRPAGPNESRRGQRGQHGGGKKRSAFSYQLSVAGQVAHKRDRPYGLRRAGFGRRERRRRRCWGNGCHQASAASHPSGSIAACVAERDRVADNNYSLVKDGTLAKHPFRSGATLSRGRVRDFTGSRGQAIAGASGVLRPQACAGLRRVSPAYAVQTRPGTCLEPGQRVWGAQFTGSGPVPHRQAGRQGRLWHCVSTDSITQKWRKARGGGESVGGWRGLREIGGGGENWELGIENYEWKAELKGAAG